MKASVHWLNAWLAGPPLSAAEIEAALTDLGFPIDAREELPGGDVRLEVEITSNRGDCLSHEGLAREVAARTGRALTPPKTPDVRRGGDAAASALTLDVRTPEVCPRFTAHVIRGVTVGPSPAWLVERLAAVGQRSINNVVDVTNYLTFEFGQPCHAFDLAKLAPGDGGRPALVVRWAQEGEPLTTLDGKRRTLKADELVVADGQRAQSLAGVIGGGDSEVSASTRDIVLEAATWDPVTVRRAARRHQIRTDAGHRFERYVDARTIDAPAAHAAALIAQLGGGTLAGGMLDAGAARRPLREIDLRPHRLADILGVAVPRERIEAILVALGLRLVGGAAGGALRVAVPAWRHDLEREVDLIEEVARVHGLDKIPLLPALGVTVRAPQQAERAAREMSAVLTGLGFFETVTFSFVSPKAARPFLPAGLGLLGVDDSRRKEEPTLRPSTLPSLLACRRANQHARAEQPGGVRLFEVAATFAERPVADGAKRTSTDSVRERRTLALLMDVPGVGKGKPGTIDQRQHALRLMRGAIEAVARAMAGEGALVVRADPATGAAALDPAASASVVLNGQAIGAYGLLDAATQRAFDLDAPVVVAELDVEPLVAAYPPRGRVHALPAFPAIERDVSVTVKEPVRWAQIESEVRGARPALLVGLEFVGTYRGKPLSPGEKSVTFRMSFREETRTLRDEEVTPQVEAVVAALGKAVGATVRTQ